MHPNPGQLKVRVKNNCPEVSIKEANRLIKELEENQVSQLTAQVDVLAARLEVMRKEETKPWNEILKEYLETGLTRRKRRLLMASGDWAVRLFAGEDCGDDCVVRAASRNGKVVLEVDKANSRLWDINGPSSAYKLLIWAASKGKIADVVGSPPETTWTTSTTPLRGPDSIHVRTQDHPTALRRSGTFSTTTSSCEQ